MGTDSEDFLSFSRIEMLHLLLDAHVVNDEEGTLHSSILHNSEKEYFPGSISVQVLLPIGTILGKSRQVLFSVVLLLPSSSCKIFRTQF